MHWKPSKITGVLINGFPFSKIATERELWWTKSADHFWCDSPTWCDVFILWVIFTPNHLHRKEWHFVILTANKPSPLIKIQLENYSFLSNRKCFFSSFFSLNITSPANLLCSTIQLICRNSSRKNEGFESSSIGVKKKNRYTSGKDDVFTVCVLYFQSMLSIKALNNLPCALQSGVQQKRIL